MLTHKLFRLSNYTILFHIHVYYKSLHSFPTRRSSDLLTGKEIIQLYVKDIRSSVPRPEKELKEFAKIELKRSEEHTSELQSRGHLVCRLLLEKKKFFSAIILCNHL